MLLGIDAGGSKTLAVLAAPDGQVLARGQAGPANYQSAGRAAALAALDAQHQAAGERIGRLEAALAAYVADPSRLADFAAAFDAYAEFYRTHMMLEEREAIPLALRVLTPEDWAEVNRVFTGERDPMSGTRGKPEDFADVFSKLVAAAPTPIGLGAGPYRG